MPLKLNANVDLSKLNEKLDKVVFKKSPDDKKELGKQKQFFNQQKQREANAGKKKMKKKPMKKKVLSPEEKKLIADKKEEYIKKGYRKADYIDYILYKCGIKDKKTMKIYIENNKLQPYKLPYCSNFRYKLSEYYECKKRTGILPIIEIENSNRLKKKRNPLSPKTIIERYNRYMEQMGHSDLKEKYEL